MTQNRKTYNLLNDEDKSRLARFAPLFDIHTHELGEDSIIIQVLDRGGWRESVIAKERMHIRLLTELSSKTLRWVYYPIGTPCSEALLGLEDSRLERIAELYDQQRETLLNLLVEEHPQPAPSSQLPS